jgi:hypothetical protein
MKPTVSQLVSCMNAMKFDLCTNRSTIEIIINRRRTMMMNGGEVNLSFEICSFERAANY